MRRTNRLKAGTLLAGTFASAAAVSAQQSSASFLTDFLEGTKNTWNFITTIPGKLDKLEKYVGFKTILGVTAVGAINRLWSSRETTGEWTNTASGSFKEYATPVIKYIGGKMLDFAGDNPFIVGVTALLTFQLGKNIYREYIISNATEEELEKSENLELKKIKEKQHKDGIEEGKIEGFNEALDKIDKAISTDFRIQGNLHKYKKLEQEYRKKREKMVLQNKNDDKNKGNNENNKNNEKNEKNEKNEN